MRAPFAPGVAINGKRYKKWISRFGTYRDAITNTTITNWLDQFKKEDQDLAARVLDAVDFYGHTQMQSAFREALGGLPGWDKAADRRKGKWRFAAMSESAGESGDAMLYQFRLANGLDAKLYKPLFVTRSELFRLPMLRDDDPQKLGGDDVVVLLDDFSGTGDQVCRAWNDPETSFGALLAGVGTVYLVLVAASIKARERISEETTLKPLAVHELGESDNVFSERCAHFTKEEQAKLLKYGKIADRKNPRGYGKCGFVVVFHHRSPNNSIPILHADHPKWIGLFPRHG